MLRLHWFCTGSRTLTFASHTQAGKCQSSAPAVILVQPIYLRGRGSDIKSSSPCVWYIEIDEHRECIEFPIQLCYMISDVRLKLDSEYFQYCSATRIALKSRRIDAKAFGTSLVSVLKDARVGAPKCTMEKHCDLTVAQDTEISAKKHPESTVAPL